MTRTRRYPQETLLRSLFDRRLMGLADRGGASGFIGGAWGNVCREWLNGLVGQPITVGRDIQGDVDSVVDIDAIPRLAAFASSRGLQNPDFLLSISTGDGPILVAADAKFSIETAKPRQVSAEILDALLDTPGSPVRAHVRSQGRARDGFFVTPDYELTHQVLNGTMGILRTAVRSNQVQMLPATPEQLYQGPHLHAHMNTLAAVDHCELAWDSDLAAALYYGRCAFGCLGCWIDETKPLLGRTEPKGLEEPAFLLESQRRGGQTSSAWQMLQQWDRDAESVRAIRVTVHQAASIGIANRDLRALVEREADLLQRPAPSMNRVRRELAKWTDAELVRRFGVVHHPVPNMSEFLGELRLSVSELQPQIPEHVRAIVASIPAE